MDSHNTVNPTRRGFLVTAAGGVGLVSCRGFTSGGGVAGAERCPTEPSVIAHRGLRQYAPENTLPAFAAAIEVGLGFELDVYQTTDGGLVVIHDGTVDRTTDGTGHVTQMAMDDVRMLDAGRWFHPSFAGLKVPTLEEVFQLVLQRQRTPVTICLDVKTTSPRIENNIVRVVDQHELFGQVFILRHTEDSLRRFKEANVKIRTSARVPGWSYDKEQFDKMLSDPLVDCLWTVDFVPSATEIERAHGLGKQVFLALNDDLPENIGDDRPDTNAEWDEAQLNKMDGILTDYPLECLWRWRRAGRAG